MGFDYDFRYLGFGMRIKWHSGIFRCCLWFFGFLDAVYGFLDFSGRK